MKWRKYCAIMMDTSTGFLAFLFCVHGQLRRNKRTSIVNIKAKMTQCKWNQTKKRKQILPWIMTVPGIVLSLNAGTLTRKYMLLFIFDNTKSHHMSTTCLKIYMINHKQDYFSSFYFALWLSPCLKHQENQTFDLNAVLIQFMLFEAQVNLFGEE